MKEQFMIFMLYYYQVFFPENELSNGLRVKDIKILNLVYSGTGLF